ncbi:MAG: response regulator transcription factor [Leptolyngbyaceae cyanobacterium RU_5_1]|nr:response regulator transcription factor [Leptolyngbyaceae cyanobacterium RU_5_1]
MDWGKANQARLTETLQESSVSSTANSSAIPAKPLRIVIVEDDPMIQLGLEQILASKPQFEVVEIVESGYLGIRAALNHKPDLVIMDIGLPQLDGIEATKQIKQQDPTVRVMMLTSHTNRTEVLAALASGADAYCVKGASIEQMLAAIAAAEAGAMYLDPQIAQLVVENLKSPPPDLSIGQLTEREKDVLKLLVEGKNNTEIGEALYLSPNTVKTHIRGIMNKLAVDDRVQAAVVALRAGLV